MNQYLNTLKTIVQQGTSSKGLALSATIGVLLGVFPVLGVTTWLITFIALRFKLNLILMMTLSYIFWPAQVILIIPFLRIGEWFWNATPFPLSLDQILLAFETSIINALGDLWQANLYAVWGWLIITIPIGIACYFLLEKGFSWMIEKKKQKVI
ncbi:MAG: DUF2062 domain-containing protein [Cocleimonas sp.]|nr:DUF2062 domain-containing protein [Cocleimonas sp.]